MFVVRFDPIWPDVLVNISGLMRVNTKKLPTAGSGVMAFKHECINLMLDFFISQSIPFFILLIEDIYITQKTNYLLKIYYHTTKFFKTIFLGLCSPVSSLKHNIYALFGRLKQYFTCFDCSICLCTILLSSGIARPIIQAETDVTASARVIRSDQ